MTRFSVLALLCLTLSACQEAPRKTESMLRLENAQQQVQDYVDRANQVLDKVDTQQLTDSLSELVYAKELQSNAQAVFPKLQIRDLAQPELEALSVRLLSLNPRLATQAAELIEQLIAKTLVLQAKVLDLNSRPLSGTSSGAKGMVDFLGDEYKKDIQDCCLEDLSRIAILLYDSPAQSEQQLSRLLSRIEAELTNILADPEYASTLRQTVSTLTSVS